MSASNPKVNQKAFDTGRLAEQLQQGYYEFSAVMGVASNRNSLMLSPEVLPGHQVPIGKVRRKDGTEHAYHFQFYLQNVIDKPQLREEFEKTWLTGALLRLGDALQKNDYFDHAPELELVYHLRNGLAHGNKFNIDKSGQQRLRKYPAHNRLAWVTGDSGEVFEIDASLNGTEVLFAYMEAGNLLDLFMSVGLYLIRMGNGDPLRNSPF